jgi:hypothetical protein
VAELILQHCPQVMGNLHGIFIFSFMRDSTVHQRPCNGKQSLALNENLVERLQVDLGCVL